MQNQQISHENHDWISNAPASDTGFSSQGLRKGKWTLEEEEYASALIENFVSGRLQLAEGTTLRVYLAEKLNCDPMRITKKFTGNDCLGKRVSLHLFATVYVRFGIFILFFKLGLQCPQYTAFVKS